MNKFNEEKSFKCKECGVAIGGHNKYLHDNMCDDCFFEEYFPDAELQFIPIKDLVLEESEKVKKIKKIHPNEEKYNFILGPIEYSILDFYKRFPKIADKDVERAIKEIKKDPFREFIDNDSSLISAILLGISEGLQNKRITMHELNLVLGWVLWCIDNRSWMGNKRAYLKFLKDFFDKPDDYWDSSGDPELALRDYDENYEWMHTFMKIGEKKFDSLIFVLEALSSKIKTIFDTSQEIRGEYSDISDEEFEKELEKRLSPKMKTLPKLLDIEKNLGFFETLFALEYETGRKYFELMTELNSLSKMERKNPEKKQRLENFINDLEEYIKEIKQIHQMESQTPEIDETLEEKTVIFKVSFKRKRNVWRSIELRGSQTLEALNNAIQNSIGWDNDHLYSFYMSGKDDDFKTEYTRSFEPEGRKTANIKLSHLGLKPGKKFLYAFDFGDNHKFDVEVLAFGEIDERQKYPRLIESHGKTPPQYRN